MPGSGFPEQRSHGRRRPPDDRPHRGDHEDRQLLQTPGEKPQECDRRLIGPLDVIDAQQQWLPKRDVDTQPVQTMQPGIDGLLPSVSKAAAGIEQGRRELRRA